MLTVLPPPELKCQQLHVSGKQLTALKGVWLQVDTGGRGAWCSASMVRDDNSWAVVLGASAGLRQRQVVGACLPLCLCGRSRHEESCRGGVALAWSALGHCAMLHPHSPLSPPPTPVLNAASQEELSLWDVRILPYFNASYLPMMPDGSVLMVDDVW